MSRKRKKKVSSQQLKQQEAEHRKLFCQKLKYFFVACNKAHLFDLIDDFALFALYMIRNHPPEIAFDHTLHLTNNEKKALKTAIHQILHDTHFTVPTTRNKLSLYDYFTVVFDARSIVRPSTVFEFPGIQQLVREMEPIYEALYDEDFMIEKMDLVCNILPLCLSELNGKHYYLECLMDNKEKPNTFGFVYRIGVLQSPSIHVSIDGANRPAFQLVWIRYKQLIPITLSAKQLGLSSTEYPEQIEIFIQNHALVRLKERVDVLELSLHTVSILLSFCNPEITRAAHNSYWIAYKIDDFKLGYFKGILIDQRLIIRTFLLLTNCGTPEEQHLRELTGLVKADYDFLNLGKLSTLVCSDVYKNEKLSQILAQAGMSSILDYARKHEEEMDHHSQLSNRMLQYLNTEFPVYNSPPLIDT